VAIGVGSDVTTPKTTGNDAVTISVDSDVTVPKTVGGDVVAISDAVDGDSTTPKYIAGGVAINEADLISNRDIYQSDLKTQNTNIMCLLDMMSKQTHLISGLATKLDGMSKRLDKMDKRDYMLAKLMNLLLKI
jgi:hypothetical protein